jgi:hypothetical protein
MALRGDGRPDGQRCQLKLILKRKLATLLAFYADCANLVTSSSQFVGISQCSWTSERVQSDVLFLLK